MKYLLTAATLISTILSGCVEAPVTAPLPGAQAEAYTEVSWGEAVRILNEGNVVETRQFHNLWVSFHLRDGTKYVAREPAIDAVFDEVNKCAACGDVALVTE